MSAQFSFRSMFFEEPESGPDAIFGKYIFDTTRPEIPPAEKEFELEQEQMFKGALYQYFSSNDQGFLRKYAKTAIDLVKNNLYSKILNPGDITVYRAIGISLTTASDILGVPEQSLSAIVGPRSIEKVMLNPMPDSQIQGWSSRPEIVRSFIHPKTSEVIIAFKTQTTNGDFFGVPGELARTSRALSFIEELETLSYGSVICDEARFVVTGNAATRQILDYVCFISDEVPT